MADTSLTLLQALNAGLARPTDSGWGIAAQTIGSSVPALYNPYASTGENLGITAGASLLAGLLGGYAKHSAAEENAQIMPLMGQIMATQDPAERAALAAGNQRLSPLVQALAFNDFERQNKLNDAIQSKQLDLVYNPQIKVAETRALEPLEMQRRVKEGLVDVGLEQGQVVLGDEQYSFGDLGLEDPIELAARKQKALDAAKFESEADNMGYNPKLEEEVDKLRKEFSSLPEVKNFALVEKAGGIIKQAIEDPSAMSDLELTRYAILLIEPGMAVREGEQAAVAKSQSIPDAIRGSAIKALNGEAELGKEAREGLLRLAMRSYGGHKAQYDRTLEFYKSEAKSKRIDPDRISYIGESTDPARIFGGIANKEQITAPDGQTYVFID